jgi:hypothetical protein
MMSDETPNFHFVVRLLRAMPARNRLLAVYAAEYWSDDRLDDAERDGDLPGRPNEVAQRGRH